MNALRVAFLIRTFWPAISHSQTICAELASEISGRNHAVTILTSKLGFDWSDKIEFRDLPVFRVSAGRPVFWGKSRYQQLLGHCLESRAPWDALIVWGLGEELEFAAREFGDKDSRLLVKLDYESLPPLTNQGHLPRRWKLLLAKSNGILVNAVSLTDFLERQGLPRNKIFYVPDAVESYPDFLREEQDSLASRRVISKVHPLLDIAANQKLVVTHSPLISERAFDPLLQAWQLYLQKFPTAKLVILGDGPAAQPVWHRLHNLRLTHSVVMPGWFDDWDPFLFAADAYVSAEYESGVCYGLTRAIARGVPCLYWQQSDLKTAFPDYPEELAISHTQVHSFADQLIRLTTDRVYRQRLLGRLTAINTGLQTWQPYCEQLETIIRSPIFSGRIREHA